MQGYKDIIPLMMYQVQLDDLVPQDNFYRRLDRELNLRFLYKATAKYYGVEGPESIDPVVFFKICLVGYLNNINSDRQLINYCSNCLDVRLFIRYDIHESLPWHSTISRTRQLYGEEVFLELFKKVLSMCVEKGMVRGKRQAIDSAFVKANASLDSLEEKEILDDVETYSKELNENSEYKITPEQPTAEVKTDTTLRKVADTPPTASLTPKDKSTTTVSKTKNKQVERHHQWKAKEYKEQHNINLSKETKESEATKEGEDRIRPKFLSNHTHHSPTDPDARISVKPGKARQMNYYAQVAVDDSHHVITAAGADFADKRDSECLAHILGQCINNLEANNIELEQAITDTGYSSGDALEYCQKQGIDAYIPNFGQYKYEREGQQL